jgi:hypothetical protein
VAKKAKTPKPPVGALVAAGIVVAVVFGMSGGGGSGDSTTDVKSAMTAAGCTFRSVKPLPPKGQGNYHADSPTLTANVKWSTDPPSAGGHYPLWEVWNFYRAPQNPRKVAHNLEHGGVAIWWGPQVPTGTIDELEAFYRESSDGIIGTPYPKLGNKIALTAWTLDDPSQYYRDGQYGTGQIAVCPSFDEDAFKAFRDAFRDQGPERGTDNSPLSGPQG